MSSQDSKNFKVKILSTSVVLMNMVQLLKSKPWNKKRLLNKFAIIIIKFMLISINGLILALISLEEHQLIGILKFVNKYF
jgi:hypothetical protein